MRFIAIAHISKDVSMSINNCLHMPFKFRYKLCQNRFGSRKCAYVSVVCLYILITIRTRTTNTKQKDALTENDLHTCIYYCL